MQKPYVGVTGFMTREDVDAVLGVVPNSPNPSRLLMIGVLVSSKTLVGLPNKWPKRYPSPNTLKNLFPADRRALNLIHFNTKGPETLDCYLGSLIQFAGPHLHGFQLNIAWPDRFALALNRLAYPEMRIVLQIGHKAFEIVDHSPEKLARQVEQYDGLIDDVLLDPSGGLGKPLDHAVLRPYLEALTAKNLDIGLGVAGGLSPRTLDLVAPLVADFPNLSIDAEGRLRTMEDTLDVPVAKEYVQKGLELFRNA